MREVFRRVMAFCSCVSCRLTIAFGAMAALLLVLIAILQFQLSRRMLEEALRNEQREKAEQSMMTLDRVLFGAQQNLVVVAGGHLFETFLESPHPDEELRSTVREELESLSLAGGPWDGLYLTDATGTIVESGGMPHAEALEPKERETVAAALAKKVLVSGAVTLPGRDRRTVLIAAPVLRHQARRSEVIGAVLGHFAWPVVEEVLHASPGEKLELLDRNGTVLVRIGELLEHGSRPIVSEVPQRGFVSYRGSGWTLRMTVPAGVTYAPVARLAWLMVIILGVILVLQLIYVRVTSSRLVTPLTELTRAAERAAEGDYAFQIANPPTIELKTLAGAFNRMIFRVGEQIAVREATEKSLQRTKSFLQLAIDNIPHPVVVGDLESREFVLVNAAGSRWLADLEPAIRALEAGLVETFAPASSGDVNIELPGGVETFRIRAVPLPETESHRRQCLFVADNLTAEREQERLHVAKEMAETATRAKSDFLARMSHELRTPMNGVMGMAQILEESELNAGQRQCTEEILVSTRSLLGIIEDILDISRVEAGRLTLRDERVDLRKLLERTRQLLAPIARAKAIDLQMNVEDEVPAQLMGDGTRLRQIVVNLLGNAVKFTPQGGQVSLTCALVSADPHSVDLLVGVRDNGVGIDPEEMGRIFQPFEQGRSPGDSSSAGTGLGLAIARNLVELMHGTLWAESTPGEGSRFSFTVRLGLPEPVREKTDVPMERRRTTRPLRVLTAEDDSTNRRVIQRMLERDGHSALFAADGQAAVALATREQPDLILMDLRMPVMDGITATAAIRATEDQTRRTPIVALTADALRGTRERCLAAGMDGFITKPVEVAELRSVLARFSVTEEGVACPT